MKIRLIIICGIFSFNLTLAQHLDPQVDTDKFKRVPLVTFSPIDFNTILNDAFKFTATQDYYLISDKIVYSFDMRYNLPVKYQDRKIHVNKNPMNIDKFLGLIEENDSCFFFSFTADQRFNNRILGVKKGEVLTFYDINGNRFDKLEDLAMSVYRQENINDFYRIFLRNYKRNLYFLDAPFYTIHSVDDAKNILKYDYNFIYYNNPSDTTANIRMFIELLDSIVSLSTDKKHELNKLFKTHIRNEVSCISIVDNFGEHPERQFDFIPLMGVNVNKIIEENFTAQEYPEVSELLAIKRARSISAYRYLDKSVTKGDDIMSTKLRLDYILKNIIFADKH